MSKFEFDEERYVVGSFDRGIIGFPDGGIKLKSGRQSPYYHNIRGMLSYNMDLVASGQMPIDKQQEVIKDTMLGYATRFDEIKTPYRHVFGKAQAGTALIAVAAFVANRSYLWERIPEDKNYGVKKRVEGNYEYGDFVHLADDNVTDGQSKVDGAGVLYLVGLQPVSLTVGFDREEGAQERLNNLGFEMNAVTCLSSAVPILRDNRRITNEHIDAVAAYHQKLIEEGVTSTYQVAA